MITHDLLTSAGVSKVNAIKYLPWLDKFAPKYGVVTPLTTAHFLAQVLHESGMLVYSKEIWGPTADQMNYERNFSKPWDSRQLAYRLGNNVLGDGHRFAGRGLIQVTGRYNYGEISQDLDIDYVSNPQWLQEPEGAVLSAFWYWDRHNLNHIAQKDDGGTMGVKSWHVNTALYYTTKKINPGLRGLSDRAMLLDRLNGYLAKQVY